MNKKENWIWLPTDIYPDNQLSHEALDSENLPTFCVTQFKKKYEFDKKAVNVDIRMSADTFFRLWVNGENIGEGPVNENHDFICTMPDTRRYSNLYSVPLSGNVLDFFVLVQLTPQRYTDYSKGHGGLYVSATVTFEDGTKKEIQTDESWLCAIDHRFVDRKVVDNTLPVDSFVNAVKTENIWNTVDSPIPMLMLERIKPSSAESFTVPANSEKEIFVYFPKVYSAHTGLDVIKCSGKLTMQICCFEKNVVKEFHDTLITDKPLDFQSMQIHSIGAYRIVARNEGNEDAIVKPYCIFTHYPVTDEGFFRCSDEKLNKLFDVCKWTLGLCRQTTHLDSPSHQEPLACTGDYYIDTLMAQFCFGDMRINELDVYRTAEILRNCNGKMFHTTYSLIWVQMLYDTYMIAGNKSLLEECYDALHILLDRFAGYIGENGIIDDPPDYMFVDWVEFDGLAMHHPPKALGQTCLNAFYYKALTTAALIADELGDKEYAESCRLEADALKTCYNMLLFDRDRGIYFDGLNTQYETNSHWLPKNVDKRFYSKHSNTLSVLYGLCDEERGQSIMEKVMTDKTLIDVQPYFEHFLLSALRKVGLFEKYGFAELERWKPLIEDSDKGLREGWNKSGNYFFDYSHAWGGTPAYQLPKELSGLEILAPGYKKITLKPRLYCYDYAYISIPTPFGHIVCDMKKGRAPEIHVPSGIDYTIL